MTTGHLQGNACTQVNGHMSDDELEEIRKRKMEQLQQQAAAEQQQQAAQDRFESQKDALLRKILSPEARQRLTNLKLVRPEIVESIEMQLLQLVQTGQISRLGIPLPMSDEHFKQILEKITNSQQKRDFRIKKI